MIETVINLRERELWPKRKLRHEDITAQAGENGRSRGGQRELTGGRSRKRRIERQVE